MDQIDDDISVAPLQLQRITDVQLYSGDTDTGRPLTADVLGRSFSLPTAI